jgi:hypothetical protein
MISLEQYMQTVGYRITEGSAYGWQCYGSNAYSISAWNGINGSGGWSANIVFDTVDQTVYEVDVCDYTHSRAYRLINPDYSEHYLAEAQRRDVAADEAWDDVNYVDLETGQDWLEKAQAIVAGLQYDTRVQVPVEFDDNTLLKYMKLAHEHDITFNQLIEQALKTVIDQHSQDPAGTRDRAQQWKQSRSAD